MLDSQWQLKNSQAEECNNCKCLQEFRERASLSFATLATTVSYANNEAKTEGKNCDEDEATTHSDKFSVRNRLTIFIDSSKQAKQIFIATFVHKDE